MILLCSVTYIKDNLIADLNIDDKLVITAITDAQEIDAHQLIGTKLLEEIKLEVKNNNLTPENKTLLTDYLRPVIARYALYYLALLLNNRFTARGVVVKESDSSTPVALEDLNEMRDELKNYADFYAQRMLRFLLANKQNYDSYLSVDDFSQICGKLEAYNNNIGFNLSGAQFFNEDVKLFNIDKGTCM